MRLISSIRHSEETPEGVFAHKYAWLMRWAMHFSRNDRSVAEDLVQDAFVRMLLSWDKLHSLGDLEPLLYSYLRYAHLTGLRRGSSYVFQSLSTVDSDTLAISLRVSNSFDQIEVQNELRSILAYLLWRKDSAKFASIFLLRFFHGFYPEEIATICVATRHSIDLSLRHARAEVKSYLLDPRSMEVPGRRRMPDLDHPNIAVPAHEFVHELRRQMLSAARDACPNPAELERIYQPSHQRSLDCGVLAHIVVCEPCIEKVTSLCGAPPPSARSMEDSLGAASRSKQSRKSSSGEKATVARILTEGKRRFREILEHHPTGLMIALNGDGLAVRDVSSKRAVLRVEVQSIEKLELVEVFSEQRTLLLSLPILAKPPFQPPQLRHQVCLSAHRTLTLQVDFTGGGASVEAVYEDPHFKSDALGFEEGAALAPISPEREVSEIVAPNEADISQFASTGEPYATRLLSLLRRIAGRMNWLPSNTQWTLLITGCAAVAAATGLWMHQRRADDAIRFERSLQRSVQSEKAPVMNVERTVTHRRLAIRADGLVVDRDLYRDSEGHRHQRPHPLDRDEQVLKAKLAEANFDWSDPLTAAGFEHWHDSLVDRPVDVEQVHGNLIVLTSTADEGPVRAESLTLRSSDLHPIARRAVLKDGETLEVAEVAYELIPWARSDPDWFEPVAPTAPSTSISGRTNPGMIAPKSLSEAEMDLASLAVLKAIEEMQAGTERLEVSKSAHGVKVAGVVETADRKQQMESRLRMIPHVEPEIFSYEEMDARHGIGAEPPRLGVVSVTSSDSQLDLHCRALQIAQDDCQRWSYRLLNSTTVLTRDSKRLAELELQYPTGKQLTSEAKTMLVSLVAGHLGHLNAALWDEQQALQTLQLWSAPQQEEEDAGNGSIAGAAKQNQAYVRELVYARNEGTRPTVAIVRDLAHSIKEARNALSHMPTYAAVNTATSSGTSTPQEN
jgi:DNA-directed RNA polymerase specialized sigma24 family protein